MAQLFAPGCSITTTKRRRFLWAAWWTESPTHVPFRAPDASNGGAATFDEARREAEARAGRPLVLLDPLWARAWMRVLRGEPPWPGAASREPRRPSTDPMEVPDGEAEGSIWATLGVRRDVTAEELKAAYRQKVIATHPDQGGDAEELQRVLRAYEEAGKRLRKPRSRRP